MKRSILLVAAILAISSPVFATTLTKALYAQIKNGMTRQQVVKLLGREPDTDTDSEMMGVKQEMAAWNNEWSLDGISVTFQNGKVFAKTQMGLK